MSSQPRPLPSSWWCILILWNPLPFLNTHTDTVPTIPLRAAFVWGQGDPVAWGPVNTHNEGLSSCTHPAGCVGLMTGGGAGCEGHHNTLLLQFKTLFRKPPEIAPFTPCTDGEKSLLVTQSHAVNRWCSYWVKDCTGRGGSSSIPAGNNGAAGQECRLQEVGSGRRGERRCSQAMQEAVELRKSLSDDGRRVGGSWLPVRHSSQLLGITLRWWGCGVESGTAGVCV